MQVRILPVAISGGSCLSPWKQKESHPLSRGSVASTLGDNDVKLVNLKKFVFRKWLLLGGEIPPLLEFNL